MDPVKQNDIRKFRYAGIMVALYQITVVHGGRHLVRVFPCANGYVVSSVFVWLYLISL